MTCDGLGCRGTAEAGDIGVFARSFVATPGVVGGDDAGDIGFGEFAVDTVGHFAEFAGIDEQRLALAVPVLGLVEEPEADGDLGAVEELAGEGDHAIDQIRFDDCLADFAFAGLVGAHTAVGQHEAGEALGGEMVDEVLDPGEVGVAFGRDAVLPADVVILAEPVTIVEGRVGEDVIGTEVGVEVAAEGVGLFGAEVGFDAADGEVHDGEAAGGGVGLLAEDGDIADAAAVGFDELFRLDEHAAGAAAGVVDAAFVGGEHLYEEADDAVGRIELAAVLAFGAGELGEEVFVDAAEDVFGAVVTVAEADGADEVDEFAETVLVERGAGVVLGEDAFEAGVIAFDGEHGVIEEFADAGLVGAGLELEPTGFARDPEDVFGLVFVGVFGVGAGVVALASFEAGAHFFEGVGDVFEEDEAEDDVFVFGGVHVIAEFIGGEPEFGFEADDGGFGLFGGGFRGTGHGCLRYVGVS